MTDINDLIRAYSKERQALLSKFHSQDNHNNIGAALDYQFKLIDNGRHDSKTINRLMYLETNRFSEKEND